MTIFVLDFVYCYSLVVLPTVKEREHQMLTLSKVPNENLCYN